MYSYLKGFFVCIEDGKVVIEVGGVGYEVSVPTSVLVDIPEAGEEIKLFVHQIVREDALELVGFADREQKRIYLKLLSISGVGPKAALAILSVLTPLELIRAVAENDYRAIARANGVGPKLAQKVDLELKDKVDKDALEQMSGQSIASREEPAYIEALQALTALGYQPNEAKKALQGVAVTDSRAMIRAALANLGSKI